ncbi:homoserine acetyltransferase [Escherichia coli]|nr:homoserine acetyltransferase [Escherichia coli]
MGKGSSKGHTPREAKDNLKSTQLLSVIDAISEGVRGIPRAKRRTT